MMGYIDDGSIEWRPVGGYEESYEVSDDGRVRSLPRTVRSRWDCARRVPGVLLKPWRATNGRLCVSLKRAQRATSPCIHRLVADAFLVESYFDGAEVCHRDGDGDNNCVTNLYWGTKSQNVLDSVRHGTHREARKTHCVHGHPFSEANTKIEIRATGRPTRRCRICRRAKERRQRANRRCAA